MERVKLVRMNDFVNKDLKVVQAQPRAVPDYLFKANSLVCICANRGAGKTNTWINMLKRYDTETQTFDRVYLICPTVENDPKYSLLRDSFFKLQIYDNFDEEIFKEILDEIEYNIEGYKQFLEDKKLYDRFVKAHNLNVFSDYEMLKLEYMGFEPPITEFTKGFPQHLIIFDDMMGNPYVYPSNVRGNLLTRFTILHRHKNTAIWHSVQNFKNTLHKSIRNNLTGLLLFKNKSIDIKHEIAKEFANMVKEQDFVEMWDAATQDGEYNFFKVDTTAANKAYRFTKNFDEAMLLDP